jgi:hypothetical protein
MRESVCGAFVLVAVLLGAPAPALAGSGPRISIAGVRGDASGAVAGQLGDALCGVFECVPPVRVLRNGRLEFRAVKAEGVAGVLFGTVAHTKRRRSLELALLTTSLRPRQKWVFRLDQQRGFAAGALEALARDLRHQLGRAPSVASAAAERRTTMDPAAPPAARPPPARAAEPPRAPEKPQAVVEPPARTAAAVALTERPSRAAAAPARSDPPREPPARGTPILPDPARPVRGTLDVGVLVTQRKLAYEGVGAGTSTLQQFDASRIVSPYVRLELTPFSAAPDRWFTDIAVFAAYARSVGLETQESSAPGIRHATTFTQLEAGLGWRFRPLASSPAVLLPRGSYRRLSLAVRPAGGGRVAGLPDSELSGPSVRLDLEVPVGRRFGVLLGAGYTRWTTAKDLIGGDPAFFPDGSAHALDASAGGWLDVAGPLSLRILADYGSTSYSLRGSGAYVATGATDEYLGVRAVMRARF